MITWSQMLLNSFWNFEISKDFAQYICILIQTVSNYPKHIHVVLDSRYSDLRMTKTQAWQLGLEGFLAQNNLGSVSRTRKALKYMWLTVLGLKDLRSSSDVANNLSTEYLRATRLLSKSHITASRPQNLSSFRVQGMHL